MTTYIDPHLMGAVRLLPSGPGDRYFDYCLEAYRPRRPWRGMLRAETLFRHSLLVAGTDDVPERICGAIQASLGTDLTVWGTKWNGERLSWELYFYDAQKEDPRSTCEAIRSATEDLLRFDPQIDESIPYMMWSFDLSGAHGPREVREINLYLTGEQAHAGRAYKATAAGLELASTYRFFAAKREIEDVLSLVKSSAFVDYADPRRLSSVLFPELFACKKICVAKKRTTDAIYFSGITVEQLVWFLRRFEYPSALVEFVAKHQEKFEHLYFDVGVDYCWDATLGRMRYPQTSYYGTF